MLGVEIAGALKNVYAIGAGIIEGIGFGYNTKTALITRGTMVRISGGLHLEMEIMLNFIHLELFTLKINNFNRF